MITMTWSYHDAQYSAMLKLNHIWRRWIESDHLLHQSHKCGKNWWCANLKIVCKLPGLCPENHWPPCSILATAHAPSLLWTHWPLTVSASNLSRVWDLPNGVSMSSQHVASTDNLTILQQSTLLAEVVSFTSNQVLIHPFHSEWTL